MSATLSVLLEKPFDMRKWFISFSSIPKISSSFRIDSFSMLLFSQFAFSKLIWQGFVSCSSEFDLLSEENLTLTAAGVFSGISNSTSLKDWQMLELVFWLQHHTFNQDWKGFLKLKKPVIIIIRVLKKIWTACWMVYQQPLIYSWFHPDSWTHMCSF